MKIMYMMLMIKYHEFIIYHQRKKFNTVVEKNGLDNYEELMKFDEFLTAECFMVTKLKYDIDSYKKLKKQKINKYIVNLCAKLNDYCNQYLENHSK